MQILRKPPRLRPGGFLWTFHASACFAVNIEFYQSVLLAAMWILRDSLYDLLVVIFLKFTFQIFMFSAYSLET